MMGQRDLAWPGWAAAAHQCDRRGGVVGRAEGALAPARGVEAAGEGAHRRRFQRLRLGHRRQDARKARGQHRLARSGWTHQQHAVPSCRRHFHGAARQQLPLDLAEIGIHRCDGVLLRPVPRQAGALVAAGEVGADLQQGTGRDDLGLRHQRGLVGIGSGQDEGAPPFVGAGAVLHGAGHRQGAADGQQLAGQ